MNRPTFEHTVNILVQAYLNDTLEHGNCCACAVGNLVAAANNFKIIPAPDPCRDFMWYGAVPSWYIPCGTTKIRYEEQAISTGYSHDELVVIERSFESGFFLGPVDTFKNLMAVVDVLAEIHNVDLSVKESAKLLFVKP
jgi:hypothetical protein